MARCGCRSFSIYAKTAHSRQDDSCWLDVANMRQSTHNCIATLCSCQSAAATITGCACMLSLAAVSKRVAATVAVRATGSKTSMLKMTNTNCLFTGACNKNKVAAATTQLTALACCRSYPPTKPHPWLTPLTTPCQTDPRQRINTTAC